MDWSKHLDSLVIWANNKNYHVDFVKNGDDCVCYVSKLIEINSSLSDKTQVIRLLHECGHVLIFENGSVYDFKSKRDYDEKGIAHKVFTLIEEAEAWRRGRELSIRLNIPITEDAWEKAMVKALKNYIDWAAKDDGEKDEK